MSRALRNWLAPAWRYQHVNRRFKETQTNHDAPTAPREKYRDGIEITVLPERIKDDQTNEHRGENSISSGSMGGNDR